MTRKKWQAVVRQRRESSPGNNASYFIHNNGASTPGIIKCIGFLSFLWWSISPMQCFSQPEATCKLERHYSLYGTDLSSELFNLTLLVSRLSIHILRKQTGPCTMGSLQDCVRQCRGPVAQLPVLTSCLCHVLASFPAKCSCLCFSFIRLILIRWLGRTEAVDIDKTLRKMHDLRKCTPLRAAGRMVALMNTPGVGPVHTHIRSFGTKECFYFSFLCLMNMQHEEIWQEKNGAYKNIPNSL